MSRSCALVRKKPTPSHGQTGIDGMHVFSVYLPVGGFRNCMPQFDGPLHERAKHADIYHAHSPFALGNYFAGAGKRYDRPTVLTFHTKFRDEFMRYTRSRALTAIMMSRIMGVMNRTQHVWTVSNGAAGTLREYGYKGDIKVIRNGTDMTVPADPDALVARVNAEYGLADEENVLLFVGRVVEVKNLALAFGALRLLKGRMKFRFVIVGDGEGMKDYRAMAEEYGLADSVLFTGTITDREYLKAFYLRADLFVFPSVFDTASLCPIEAAAFGLPALLVEGSPTAEIVKDGFSGYTRSGRAACVGGAHTCRAERSRRARKSARKLPQACVPQLEGCGGRGGGGVRQAADNLMHKPTFCAAYPPICGFYMPRENQIAY